MRGSNIHPNPAQHFVGLPPPPRPEGIPKVRIADGGITDKSAIELMQLGNQIQIPSPPTSISALGLTTVWTSGSNELPGPGGAQATNTAVIQQARSVVPDHPKTLLININPPIIDVFNRAIYYDLKVRASWGVGTDRCSAVIDVINGAQFSLSATEVVLEGLYTLIDLQAASPTPALVGSCIGEYPRSGSEFGPSFTATVLSYPAGPAPVDIVVPSYAKAVTVFPGLIGGGPVNVTIGLVVGNAALASYSRLATASECPCTIPLPNTVTRVRLTPVNVTDKAIVRFDLAL